MDAGFVRWGSFTRPDAEEALVNISGCSPITPSGSRGAILLRNTPSGWRRVFVTLERDFDVCMAIAAEGAPTTLVCEVGSQGAGGIGGLIQHCMLSAAGAHCEDLVSTGFPTSCMRGDTIESVTRDDWRLEDADGGLKVLKISMSYGSSRAKADHDCTVPEAQTRHVVLEFAVDGKRLRPTPSTKRHLLATHQLDN